MPVSYPNPVIIVHLRLVGQAVMVDHIDMTPHGNDNGDEAEAWRIAHNLLHMAAQKAIEMHVEKTQAKR